MGVKVAEPLLHKEVCHLPELRKVDAFGIVAVGKRQAHGSKAELSLHLNTHVASLPSQHMSYLYVEDKAHRDSNAHH